jgi:hypothetical protein
MDACCRLDAAMIVIESAAKNIPNSEFLLHGFG